MAQYKKEEVQALILSSAEKLFSHKGYTNTTISDIAKSAGISVGNIYSYYKGKEQILNQILPPEFVEALRRKSRAKMLTGKAESITEQSQNIEFAHQSEEFQRYLIENRYKIIILLKYSKETPYETFRADTVEHLVKLILEKFAPHPEKSAELEDLLRVLYDGYIQMTLKILAQNCEDSLKLTWLNDLNRYHIMGLEAIIR